MSSIAWGHTTGRLLAFAYVRPPHTEPGAELQVVVMGTPRAARVLAEPVYDPENSKPRS